MTGPFVRAQETKLYGPTWVNAARIVKIQAAADGTTILLEGASTMQTDEPVEAFIGPLDAALAEPMLPRAPVRSPHGSTWARTKPAGAHDA